MKEYCDLFLVVVQAMTIIRFLIFLSGFILSIRSASQLRCLRLIGVQVKNRSFRRSSAIDDLAFYGTWLSVKVLLFKVFR